MGGGPTGPLGIKDGGVYPIGAGFGQNFAGGKIFFTPETGAHAMSGAILDEYRPGHAVFIDDLPQHHGSVAEIAPHVTRLHLCGEPLLAPHIACAHQAGHAHARIDDWASALPWLLDRIEGVTA